MAATYDGDDIAQRLRAEAACEVTLPEDQDLMLAAAMEIVKLRRLLVSAREDARLDYENTLQYLDECNAEAEAHRQQPLPPKER